MPRDAAFFFALSWYLRSVARAFFGIIRSNGFLPANLSYNGGKMILADSLVQGFLGSNFMGQALVVVQLIGSIVMVAVIIGKTKELSFVSMATRRFMRDFSTGRDVLDYYLQRRPSGGTGIEGIYKETCERLLKLLTPDVRSLLVGRQTDGDGAAALTAREIELVRGTCEHVLDEEEIRVENGMGVIATVVALEPMLGLLGTVWGVLDAFAEMGSAGSANLATIAPSISAALVTTVVGLLVAIPGVVAFNRMNSTIRNITSEMEGFADELIGRIACEFQGRGA
jgi:biopolymer transport protein ExbB/TolQ